MIYEMEVKESYRNGFWGVIKLDHSMIKEESALL
jgi:hypothetical protein